MSLTITSYKHQVPNNFLMTLSIKVYQQQLKQLDYNLKLWELLLTPNHYFPSNDIKICDKFSIIVNNNYKLLKGIYILYSFV